MWFLQSGLTFEAFILRILAVLTIVFLILPLHEFAHGWIAYKLGDNTAKYSGRLTLNPLVHIDPLGALLILLVGFGWANPVPINPRNFKNPKAGMALTALAGPLSNIIAAFIGMLLNGIILGLMVRFMSPINMGLITGINTFFSYYIIINIGLAVFNLIPIPPLDGSKILGAFLSDNVIESYYKYQNITALVLFALIFMGVLDFPLSFLQNVIYNGLYYVSNLILSPFGV